MQEKRFYPLIDMSTDGKEKQALFPTDDPKTVSHNHRLWLSEAVTGCFRLCASEPPSAEEVAGYHIYCPRCGREMQAITVISEEAHMPLYICDTCRKTI